MKIGKKILGFTITTFLVSSTFTMAFAGVVAGNYNYADTSGYSLSQNRYSDYTYTSTQPGTTTSTKEQTVQQSTNSSTTGTRSYSIGGYSTSSYGTNSYVIPKTSNYTSGGASYTIPKSTTNNTSTVTETNTPVQQAPTSSNTSISQNRITLMNMINEERVNAGLNPLKMHQGVFEIAQKKSQDMYDNNYFSHDSPTFGRTSTLIRDAGISYYGTGENIGRTSSVERAHNGFMNSEGHRANIMNPKFTHIGIGIVGNYYTEVFVAQH